VRITGLRADGFGVFHGLEIDGLSEGLHVFYGPNEAGKTTLMQFVRSMLYGFSPERRRYLPPVHGGRPGGQLQLATSEGRLEVCRHDNVDEPARGDLVSVVYPDGTRQSEHVLKTILSGTDENIFNHVFCVGLRELQELGTLSDTDAARMLYDLSTGLGAISLAEVVQTLAEARNHVLDADGRPCEISRLLEQRNRLRADLEEISRVTRDYGRLAAERTRSEREIERLEEETRRVRHELRVAEIADSVRVRWKDRLSADRQLAAIGPTDSIPEGAIHRLEVIESRLAHRRELLKAWKSRWSKLRREAHGLKSNDTLERLGPRIEALREQEPWIKTLRDRTAELESEITDLESKFAIERRQFGLRDDDTSSMPSLSANTMQVLRHPARAMKQARSDLEQAQRALADTEERALSLSEQVESGLEGWGVDDLSLALQRQGDAVARLRRRVQVDQRIGQMQDHQAELGEQGRSLVENQIMPMWLTFVMGAAYIAGIFLFFALALFTESGFGLWGWWLAVWLVGGGVALVVFKKGWERNHMSRLKACRRQASMLASQVEEAHREREKLDRELPRGDDTVQERLKDAERQMAELEAFVGRDAQRLSAQEEADSAAKRLEDAKRAVAQAKNRWRNALVSSGLPADLAPGQIRSLIARNEEMVDVRRRLDHRYEELQQRNRELEALNRRVADVVAEAALSASPDDPIEGMRVLSRALADQQAQQKRLDELRIRARRMRRKRKKIDKSVRRHKAFRRRLFHEVGTTDETEFRRRASHFAEIESLRASRAAIHREIEAAIAAYCSEEIVAEALEGQTAETLRDRCEELRAESTNVEKRLQERCEQRGRHAEQLRILSDDRAAGAKQLEMNMVEQQLADALHRWRVRAMACHTLAEIRESYQRDRQPETLQEASDYLERLTQGRYTRVWTPLDENVLLVDDGDGNPRSVDLLSQGTREQLFICLRLALAAGFARRGTVLPLILDDVLVNFDVQRAQAVAEVMRDFAAAGHQVLVFTCHEHIQKLFKSLKVPVDVLPARSEQLTVAKPKPQPKRAKKVKQPKPAPAPEPEPEPVAEEPVIEEIVAEPEPIEEPEVIELGTEQQVVRFDVYEEEEEAEPEDLWEEVEDTEKEEEFIEGEWEEIVDEEPEEEEDSSEEAYEVAEDEDDEADPDDDWDGEEDEYETDEDDSETYEEAYEEEDEEEDEEEAETDSTGAKILRRRPGDDWDDRYEDEYDEVDEDESEIDDSDEDEYEYDEEDDAEAA
jgi:uncharacterized protein YhaN